MTNQPESVTSGYYNGISQNGNHHNHHHNPQNQNNGGSHPNPTNQPYVYPQYNPTNYPVNPIPGSQGINIGVYPPRPIDTEIAYPNFNIAISRWPFYALPFPFNLENIVDINASLGGAPSGTGHTAGFNPFQTNCQCNQTKNQVSNQQEQQKPSAHVNPTPGQTTPQNYFNQPNGSPNQHPSTYGGIIGFIPIVFFPAPCQQNSGAAYPLFPEAFPFQAPCSTCGQNKNDDQPQPDTNKTPVTDHHSKGRTPKAL